MSLALNVPGARIIAERSGPLGRLSVIENREVPLRHAPGLSLATTLTPPEQLGIFTDGEGMTAVTRFDGDLAALCYLDQQTAALPFHLIDRPATLVLGSGGGADVLMALHDGAADRCGGAQWQLAQLVRGFRRLRRPYLRPSRGDAPHCRSAKLRRGERARWDLIQLSLLDSFAASAAGVQALRESPIYTIEAVSAYLDHLAPGGMLAITRWLGRPPRETLKLFATAISALEARARPRRPGDWCSSTAGARPHSS